MRLSELKLGSLFSFAERVNICSKLLGENLDFDLTVVQLLVHGEQRLLLLLSQQVPDLLVLSCYGFLCAGGRLLQESVRRTSRQEGSRLAVSSRCRVQILSLPSGCLVFCSYH